MLIRPVPKFLMNSEYRRCIAFLIALGYVNFSTLQWYLTDSIFSRVIFCSNDDPIFSHVNLDNAGELWSSKDVSDSPAPMSLDTPSPAGGLRNRSEPLEIKADSFHCNDQSFTLSYEKIRGSSFHDIQNVHAVTSDMKYAGGRCKPAGKEHQVG